MKPTTKELIFWGIFNAIGSIYAIHLIFNTVKF